MHNNEDTFAIKIPMIKTILSIYIHIYIYIYTHIYVYIYAPISKPHGNHKQKSCNRYTGG